MGLVDLVGPMVYGIGKDLLYRTEGIVVHEIRFRMSIVLAGYRFDHIIADILQASLSWT